MLCDDKIQISARDTRGEVGNPDMGNFTIETPWSKLRFVSNDWGIANCL